MRKLLFVLVVGCAWTATTRASDIAFYVGAPNVDGWYTVAAQTKDVDTIISLTGHLFGDAQRFGDAQFAEFGAWVDAHTNNGQMDILWLNGCMPSVLYPYPNLQPNGSRVEKWLEGGNMIINVGDWFGYVSYEGDGTRKTENGPTGAANILNLSSGIIVSADNTILRATPAGKKYLPSLPDPTPTSRPIALNQVVAPWEVAAIFASTGGTEARTESRADPVVIHNTVTGAYVVFVNQGGTGSWITDRGLTCAEFIKNWVNEVIGLRSPALAGNPLPEDGAVDVPRDTMLSWTAGQYPATHDVYLGTSFTDVNTATRTNPKGVLASRGQVDTTFDPPEVLAYGQSYYWRIDEVNKTPDNTAYKGNAWSFTVEPYGYPVKPVKATASSFQTGMGPEKTIDGSGLTRELHSTEPTSMWLSAGVQPNWIQYEFDQVYKLHQLMVWNSNQLIESFLGFGAKTVTIETSADGATWAAVTDVPEFARAPGLPAYAANTTVSLGGVEAKFVKLTITANWGGMAPQTGLAEVQFSYVPVQAFAPQPANAATGVSVDASLNWRPGREATSHQVLFGTDQAAVAGGTASAKTVAEHGYRPDPMALGTTYYWRVDEVGETGTHVGEVWSFTTQEFKVVDDFESYTDKAGAEVYTAWPDGFDNPATNGAVVGLDMAVNGTFGETTIIHGGKQSMPFAYDNSKAPLSEAVLTMAPAQNWTASGIKSLSLWFRGVAGNGGQLYVKVNSTKVLYDGEAADLARAAWQVWNIDLSKAGNVSSVRSLAIGIEGAGAKGLLYIDDIRLYPREPQYITPADPGRTNLVGHWALDGNANDGSGRGNNGTVTAGTAQWVPGMINQALQLNGGPTYVDCGNGASLNLTDAVTITAWIKMDFTAGDRKIAGNQDGTTGGYKLGVYSSNKVEFEIRTAANASTLNRNAPGGIALQQGVWYHVAGVYSRGQYIRTYVLGSLDRELVTTAVLGSSTGTFKLGREPFGAGGAYWLGALDDVQVYNRALSREEILWLSGQKKPVAQPF